MTLPLRVIPAKAGIQPNRMRRSQRRAWIPAFAGMTVVGLPLLVFAQALVYPTPHSETPAAAPAQVTPAGPSLSTAATASASAEAAKPASDEESGIQIAVLLGTNKVTARSVKIEAALGTTVRFGNLEIVTKRCQTTQPPARADQGALLDVWELKPAERPAQIFNGWMFAGTPSLSALQHPVYDLTLLRCERKNGPVE